MEKTVEIIICSSCITNNYTSNHDLEDILNQVESLLREARPEIGWNLTTQNCFKFCPKDRITISVSDRMTMTRAATVDSIVKEVLSFFRK